MDSNRVDEAHPAYPIIIRQLSSDEAKILASLKSQEYEYTYTRDYDRTTNLFLGLAKIEVDALPRDGLVFPKKCIVLHAASKSAWPCGHFPSWKSGTLIWRRTANANRCKSEE
jgi:hypothetical protein